MIRMQLGEWLIDLGIWLMPRRHPHKICWVIGRKRAQRLIEANP
jgi:hypothetical protein